jgi:hypothetical protein
MIKHALFPTLVTEQYYNRKDDFKQVFFDKIFDYMNEDGISNEETNHVNLHHEPAFKDLFVFATESAKEYVAALNVQPELFDFNVVKTWMNITKSNSTPAHNHADAHISFTYYAHLDANCIKPIRFYNYKDRHEPYPGLIKFNNPMVWDAFNSYTWEFFPKEGNLFVFPGNLSHDTVGYDTGPVVGSSLEQGCKNADDLANRRICLAGDILLTFKERSPKAMGLQPIHEWRKFA